MKDSAAKDAAQSTARPKARRCFMHVFCHHFNTLRFRNSHTLCVLNV